MIDVTKGAEDSSAPSSRSAGQATATKKYAWPSKLPTPLTTTILAGILTVAGTIAGTFVQGWETLQLEHEKEQHELVMQMITIGNNNIDQAKKNLLFLTESGLITDTRLATKIRDAAATGPILPSRAFSGPLPGAPCGCNKATGVCLGVVNAVEECVPN